MKNLSSFCFVLLLLMGLSLGCKNNPFSASLYTCKLPDKPMPKTSDDYYERALDHIEISSKGSTTNIDACAMEALNETIRLDPNNANAYRVRGNGYRQKDQYELALADFDKAIQLDPNTDSNLYSRRYFYEKLEKFDKAIEDQTAILNLHLKNNPTDKEKMLKDYEERAELFEKSGNYENAIIDYSELLRLKPNSVLYFSQRAKAYEKKGDFVNAVKDYTEIILIEPNEANHYYLRAEANRRMGKTDLAEADTAKFNELLAAKEGKNKTSSNPKLPQIIPNSYGVISVGVLNNKAINLVQPEYSPAAKVIRASGEVNVQAVLDENGNVIAVKAISGEYILRPAAETAARASKFNPTIINGKPAKVTGVIVYNFTTP